MSTALPLAKLDGLAKLESDDHSDRGRASIDNVAMREERPWQTQVIAGVESAAQRDQLYEVSSLVVAAE